MNAVIYVLYAWSVAAASAQGTPALDWINKGEFTSQRNCEVAGRALDPQLKERPYAFKCLVK